AYTHNACARAMSPVSASVRHRATAVCTPSEVDAMCGIAGVVDFENVVRAADVRRMTDAIAHRGPDGEAQYVDRGVGLGHRRPAIIDLSPAGSQPMPNEAGDVLLVHNGEIYNYRALRSDLEARGHRFRSQTDTEVIVHAYEEWGDACVNRFNGMFAF